MSSSSSRWPSSTARQAQGNNVNTASLVNLKAELARKQEEYVREKNDPSARDERLQQRKSKRAAGWIKQNKGVLERHRRDVLQQEQEGQSLVQVEAKLKAKAALYERLRQGDMTPEEQEKYLVDFEQKILDRLYNDHEDDDDERQRHHADDGERDDDADSDELVEYVDSFGRKRRCTKKELAALQALDEEDRPTRDLVSEDMQREERRQQWEEQMEAERNQPRGPIHYETVRAGEIRNLGTGYFAFSKDEIERGQQRELLEQLREETQRGRSKREKLKQRRERALQARLAKIRQRRGDGGAPPSKSAKTQQDAGASQQQAERDEAEEKEAEVEAEEEEEDIDDVLDALMPSDD